MYEVILLLEQQADSVYNPSFYFRTSVKALQLVELFTSQGYLTSIQKLEEGSFNEGEQ